MTEVLKLGQCDLRKLMAFTERVHIRILDGSTFSAWYDYGKIADRIMHYSTAKSGFAESDLKMTFIVDKTIYSDEDIHVGVNELLSSNIDLATNLKKLKVLIRYYPEPIVREMTLTNKP